MAERDWTFKDGKWKNGVIAACLLLGFAFFINRGIEIKGLYMDDLYLWSCYGEQSFRQFVIPIGSSRFRFIYYLAAWLELAIIGNHINWFVPFHIILNSMIAFTVYRFGKRLSGNWFVGFISGILYLLSRMSYYQIGQVYGLMESMALWAALGIFYCLYRYVNESGRENLYLIWANILYFCICFIHERYMVLLPLILAALLLKREKKISRYILTAGVFGAVQLIRFLTIGTVAPAGTGGTNVTDTFHIKDAIKFAISQVLYIFGINAGPEHLSGQSWSDSPSWVHIFVVLADIALAILLILFLIRIIKDKTGRKKYMANSLLFILFIGLCIACSSVTIRVETRWIYVSMTAAWLFVDYMFGVITLKTVTSKTAIDKSTAGKTVLGKTLPSKTLPSKAIPGKALPGKKATGKTFMKEAYKRRGYQSGLLCGGLILFYACFMLPVETHYRAQYPNLYFWADQQRYNSLAEETFGRYGNDIFGKKIYIVGNNYNMSDFTARTFFKEFDKNRKAEGTEVQFINSIHDIGQIANNMIVLSEEPSHNTYQDITDMVRKLKCESIYGYYSDGWMDESSSLRVMTGSTGKIQLQIFYPGEITGKEESRITIDDRDEKMILINQNSMTVELEAQPRQIVNLKFENNFYLKDAQEQRGEKKFSMIVNITAD
jgi:hypothetical protein